MAEEIQAPNGTGGTQAGSASDTSRWQARKIVVQGQEILVEDEAKAVELMQKGARFQKGQEENNRRAKELEAQQAALEVERQRFQNYELVDQVLRQDPEKAELVNAILADKKITQIEGQNGDDPVLKMLKEQDRKIEAQGRELQALKSGVTTGIGGMQRARTLDAEERTLRGRFGQLATDERIDAARRQAESRGLSLEEAFKITTFEDLGDFTRGQVIEEYGLDPASLSPQRGETLTLDGFGTLTPENMERLNQDPDLYAKHRPAIRAWRLARSKGQGS
jgi:hypothetical protein